MQRVTLIRNAILLLALWGFIPYASGGSDQHQLDIPAQVVEQALQSLAQQAGKQLLFSHQTVDTLTSNAIKGRYSLQQALEQMLTGTGLSADQTDSGVIVVTWVNKRSGIDRWEEEMNTRKTLIAGLVGMFVGGGAQVSLGEENESLKELLLLDEIIVTANKRSSGVTLQETPVAISVLTDEDIVKRGLTNMNDYLAYLPGASYIEISATNKNVVLRGLSLGPSDQQAVSSTYLGEMPLSTASDTFDINLIDIERVEVVKGPQGTLYGNSAIGGVIRNIPVAPDLSQLEGNISFGVSHQSKSDDLNSDISGVINIPIIEDYLAFRVSAYGIDNAGYVDIINSPTAESVVAATGSQVVVKDDSGGHKSTGGRASLLWKPIEELDITLIVGTQEDDVDGRNEELTALGGYEISYLNTAPKENVETNYSNLIVEYDLGWAVLLSSSSLLGNEGSIRLNYFPTDQTSVFGPGEDNVNYDNTLKTQEFRMISKINDSLEVLVGLFYEDALLETVGTTSWVGSMPDPFPGAGVLIDSKTVLDYEQKAIFGEISYSLSDEWLLTLGGRNFQYDREDIVIYRNNAPFNQSNNEEDVSQSGNTYKANIAYTPNDDVLIYGQWSEGFRLGRGQSLPSLDLCDTDNNGELDFDTGGILTTRVEPDTTENIELGVKLSLLDNSLTFNTALFRTDWDNIPVAIQDNSSVCPGTTNITNNIGEARSQGVEFEASYVVNDWRFNLAASYLDTERTKVRAPIVEGESLVYAPKTNASIGFEYSIEAFGYPGFVRADIAYVGEYESATRSSSLINNIDSVGDYVNTNLRFGVNLEQWDISLFVDNLTNNDDVRVHNNGPVGVRARPRETGFKITREF